MQFKKKLKAIANWGKIVVYFEEIVLHCKINFMIGKGATFSGKNEPIDYECQLYESAAVKARGRVYWAPENFGQPAYSPPKKVTSD